MNIHAVMLTEYIYTMTSLMTKATH